MNQPSTGTRPLSSADQRARIRQSFGLVLIGTPWLLFIDPVRRIVSLEATLLAIVAGVVLGAVAAVVLAGSDAREINDVAAVVGTLACLCVATLAVWILVPHQYTGTFVQFALAFTWTMPVVQLLSYHFPTPEAS